MLKKGSILSVILKKGSILCVILQNCFNSLSHVKRKFNSLNRIFLQNLGVFKIQKSSYSLSHIFKKIQFLKVTFLRKKLNSVVKFKKKVQFFETYSKRRRQFFESERGTMSRVLRQVFVANQPRDTGPQLHNCCAKTKEVSSHKWIN